MNILKLAKNLNEFTLDEIEMLAEFDCRNELENLIQENTLRFDGKTYKYCSDEKILFFELNQKTEFKIGKRTHRTFLSYRYQFKNNILPYFCRMFLDEITPAMINDFMSFLKTRYSAKTVEHGIKLLGSVLNWAFYEGLLERNPYYGMKQIKKGTTK
jgi:hypothetical protein